MTVCFYPVHLFVFVSTKNKQANEKQKWKQKEKETVILKCRVQFWSH